LEVVLVKKTMALVATTLLAIMLIYVVVMALEVMFR